MKASYIHVGYNDSLIAQRVNKYGHAIYKPTLNRNEHFTPHQFAKFENKHHCTGTLAWNGHVLRTASSPREDCITPVYLIKQNAYCDRKNISVQFCIFVCIYVRLTGCFHCVEFDG